MADYAGDLSVNDAWELLQREPKAVLVDVRTRPEWQFVGVPDLERLGKNTAFVSWQNYPGMERNGEFVAAVKAAGAAPDAPVLFICRSGGRSRAAAIALTAAGFSRCYNVAGGFEGNPDATRHRGTVDGWKAAGLPWVQE